MYRLLLSYVLLPATKQDDIKLYKTNV